MSESTVRLSLAERDLATKLVRANKHLHDLEAMVDEYRATTAIGCVGRCAGGRSSGNSTSRSRRRRSCPWCLATTSTTSGPHSTTWRSPCSRRSTNAARSIDPAPERIWEIPEATDEAQNCQVTRKRWALIENNVNLAAVEIIKAFHPPSGRPSRREQMHDLTVLNGLSNRDRHQTVNLVAHGLDVASSQFVGRHADGSTEVLTPERPPDPYRSAHPTGAPLELPPGAEPIELSRRDRRPRPGRPRVVERRGPRRHAPHVGDGLRHRWKAGAALPLTGVHGSSPLMRRAGRTQPVRVGSSLPSPTASAEYGLVLQTWQSASMWGSWTMNCGCPVPTGLLRMTRNPVEGRPIPLA